MLPFRNILFGGVLVLYFGDLCLSFPQSVEDDLFRSEESCSDTSDARCVSFDRCVREVTDYGDYSIPNDFDLRQSDTACLDRTDLQDVICCDVRSILPEEKEASPGACELFDGYSCVSQDLCRNGIILTDGTGVLGVRQESPFKVDVQPQNSKCKGDLEVCCQDPPDYLYDYTEDASPKTPKEDKAKPFFIDNYSPSCGRRRPDGFSVEVRQSSDSSHSQFAEWPHMCSMLKRNPARNIDVFLGGASLVAPGIVITVAHYVNDTLPELLSIRCGDWDTKSESEPLLHQERKVQRITLHPRFDINGVKNDIAVLHMAEDFILAPHVDTICLPNPNGDEEDFPSYDRENCFATGWGVDSFEGGEYQTIMKEVELTMVDFRTCERNFRKTRLGPRFVLDKSVVCAGGDAGEDTCKGDGGGPLMCASLDDPSRFMQVGITSWGIGCGAAGVPGAYVSVKKAACFIRWAARCFNGDDYNKYLESSGTEGQCDNYINEEISFLEDYIVKIRRNLGRAQQANVRALIEANLEKHESMLARARNLNFSCLYDVSSADADDDDRGSVDGIDERSRDSEVDSTVRAGILQTK